MDEVFLFSWLASNPVRFFTFFLILSIWFDRLMRSLCVCVVCDFYFTVVVVGLCGLMDFKLS